MLEHLADCYLVCDVYDSMFEQELMRIDDLARRFGPAASHDHFSARIQSCMDGA
jgi:hypothetical protein